MTTYTERFEIKSPYGWHQRPAGDFYRISKEWFDKNLISELKIGFLNGSEDLGYKKDTLPDICEIVEREVRQGDIVEITITTTEKAERETYNGDKFHKIAFQDLNEIFGHNYHRDEGKPETEDIVPCIKPF